MAQSPTSDAVLQAIQSAFHGVALGEGIGLWQAQAIDDYADEAAAQRARRQDEQMDWTRIPVAQLKQCDSSLCFFDAAGMRFHLPAFLCAELNGQNGSVIFSLTQLDDYKRSMLAALDGTQRGAVVQFLQFCLSDALYENEHWAIQRALDEYWLA
ncbi:MAG: DUF6714 family protein [Pseudomonadota bacterium]